MYHVASRRAPFAELWINDEQRVQQDIVVYDRRPTLHHSHFASPLFELMQQCWRAKPSLRPTADAIVKHVDRIAVSLRNDVHN
jgi:hypothetical protein